MRIRRGRNAERNTKLCFDEGDILDMLERKHSFSQLCCLFKFLLFRIRLHIPLDLFQKLFFSALEEQLKLPDELCILFLRYFSGTNAGTEPDLPIKTRLSPNHTLRDGQSGSARFSLSGACPALAGGTCRRRQAFFIAVRKNSANNLHRFFEL